MHAPLFVLAERVGSGDQFRADEVGDGGVDRAVQDGDGDALPGGLLVDRVEVGVGVVPLSVLPDRVRIRTRRRRAERPAQGRPEEAQRESGRDAAAKTRTTASCE
ncbi:hypothetical protein [Pengzhenrongella sp.]|uniref:hypothetical protein n=1 Tax=Pengzhenrongella sp. TaxID=2888820 RepID=UPI002F927341